MNKLHKSESINHYSAPIDFSTSFRRFTLSPTVYSLCRIRFLTLGRGLFFSSRSSDFPLRTNKAVFFYFDALVIWLSICMHSPFIPFFCLSLSLLPVFSPVLASGTIDVDCQFSHLLFYLEGKCSVLCPLIVIGAEKYTCSSWRLFVAVAICMPVQWATFSTSERIGQQLAAP